MLLGVFMIHSITQCYNQQYCHNIELIYKYIHIRTAASDMKMLVDLA